MPYVPGPSKQGQGKWQCALRMTPFPPPRRPSEKQPSLLLRGKPHSRKASLGPPTGVDENLPHGLATLGSICLQLLNPQKVLPGLPAVLDKRIFQVGSFSVVS